MGITSPARWSPTVFLLVFPLLATCCPTDEDPDRCDPPRPLTMDATGSWFVYVSSISHHNNWAVTLSMDGDGNITGARLSGDECWPEWGDWTCSLVEASGPINGELIGNRLRLESRWQTERGQPSGPVYDMEAEWREPGCFYGIHASDRWLLVRSQWLPGAAKPDLTARCP